MAENSVADVEMTPQSDSSGAAKRSAQIRGLRELADFLEAHAAVPVPVLYGMNAFANDRAEIAAAARVGGWRKQYRDNWFTLERTFSGDCTLEVNIARATVCRKVVTGTVLVPAQPEREVETYEWVCEDRAILAESAVQS